MKQNPIKTILDEKTADFERQYDVAAFHVEACEATDNYWGDNVATIAAAANVSRAAKLAVEVIALRKALKLWILIAFVGASAACSGGGSGPNVPSHAGRKLTGTWDGTLVISRRNVPDSAGQLRWTFTVDEVAPVNGYRVQVVSNNPWLPFTTTGISVLDAPGGQTSPIYTHGVYTSPRGCSETFSSQGIASDTRIDASFTSADCDSQTFTGSVTLTRSTR